METGRLIPEDQGLFAGRTPRQNFLLASGGGFLVVLLLVACLAAFLGTGLQFPQFAVAVVESDDYTESTTGIVFSAKAKVNADSSGDYRVLGAGPRIKAIGPIGVKVYGVAYYAEAKAARGALKSFQGKSTSTLTADPSYYDALEHGAFNKMVEIRMKRAVDRDTMVNALTEALRPRMKARDAERAEELVSKFQALFTDKGFKTGDSIRIIQIGKALHLSVNGDKRPAVQGEPKLCEAFFAIYTDEDTPAPEARKHLADRLQSLWQ